MKKFTIILLCICLVLTTCACGYNQTPIIGTVEQCDVTARGSYVVTVRFEIEDTEYRFKTWCKYPKEEGDLVNVYTTSDYTHAKLEDSFTGYGRGNNW